LVFYRIHTSSYDMEGRLHFNTLGLTLKLRAVELPIHEGRWLAQDVRVQPISGKS
jgi:hypothetical protein